MGWLPPPLVQPRDMDGDTSGTPGIAHGVRHLPTPQHPGCCRMSSHRTSKKKGAEMVSLGMGTLGIPVRGLQASQRRATTRDGTCPREGPQLGTLGIPARGRGHPRERSQQGTVGTLEKGWGPRASRRGLWLGTAGILEKGHSWGPRGSWRRTMTRTKGTMETVGVGDCRHPGPEKDHDGDPQHLGEG